MSRPNILIILSDQHNAKVLGHKNHPDVKTPHLDRMAAEGVRFDNAIAQNPICTPSRLSFLSGQYCHNHGYYGLSGPKPHGLPSIFSHFKKGGYRTGYFGKSHLPAGWIEEFCDRFQDPTGGSVRGVDPEYMEMLKERGMEQLAKKKGLPQFQHLNASTMEGCPSPLPFDYSEEGFSTNRAIDFMGKMCKEIEPFLTIVSFPRPHQITYPSEPFWSMYDESSLTLPPNADSDLTGKAPHLIAQAEKWRSGDWTLFEPKTYQAGRLRKLHGYLGAVSQMDHGVGLLMDFLGENGLGENTIVVYSSDHGEYNCEHGLMEKKPGNCSDAVTRIPFIWWAPGRFRKGHLAKEIVESVDLSNTLCSLAGLDLMETSDGKDLSALLQGKQKEVHTLGVTEMAWSKSIRKGNYRFVYYPKEMFVETYPDGFGELYDLENDPWEMNNLFFEPKYKELIQSMLKEFLDWLVTTTRPATVRSVNSVIGMEVNEQRIFNHRCITNEDLKIHPDEIRKLKDNVYNFDVHWKKWTRDSPKWRIEAWEEDAV